MEVKILGKIVGNASGWDEMSEVEVMYYDFQPNWDKMEGLRGYDISINLETGQIAGYDEEDECWTAQIKWDL